VTDYDPLAPVPLLDALLDTLYTRVKLAVPVEVAGRDLHAITSRHAPSLVRDTFAALGHRDAPGVLPLFFSSSPLSVSP